jgi:RHS repeat-associated protein
MSGYVVGTNNELKTDGTSTFTYDSQGNMVQSTVGASGATWTFAYDNADRLVGASYSATLGGSVTQMVTIIYDSYGNRIEEDYWNGSTTAITRYAVDGWNTAQPAPMGNENFNDLIDLNSSNAVVTRRLFGPGVDDPIAREDASGNEGWYETDELGNVRGITNGTGTPLTTITYDGWGNVLSNSTSAQSDRYLKAGSQWDSALQQWINGARVENGDGRWDQEDPDGFKAGDTNLYRYVGNDPVNAKDPSGLLIWTIPAAPAAAVIGITPVAVAVVATAGLGYLAYLAYDSSPPADPLLDTRKDRFDRMAESADNFWQQRLNPSTPETLPGDGDFSGDEGAGGSFDDSPAPNPHAAPAIKPEAHPKPQSGATQTQTQVDNQKACFAAGTQLRTPTGRRNIEELVVGDLVLSRDEFDPSGQVQPKVVEEVFVTEGLVWHLHTCGQVIRTTAEHPFYVSGSGWVACNQLKVGDWLLTEDGLCVRVDDLLDTGLYETLYNVRIADFHTYFVGCDEWGFSVWAHNACAIIYWYPPRTFDQTLDVAHLSVATVPDKGLPLNTEMAYWGAKGQGAMKSEGTIVQEVSKENEAKSTKQVEVPLPNFEAARQFQESVLNKPSQEKWSIDRNCFSHVADVLQKGGVAIGETATEFLRWLGGKLGFSATKGPK